MTPVDQTVFDDGKGDCLRACIASILDLPITDLPNFAESDYVNGAITWLWERCIPSLHLTWTGNEGHHDVYMSTGYTRVLCVVMGTSPRGQTEGSERRKGHAVVGHAMGWSFSIDHDPHPSRAGLIGNPDSALWIFLGRPESSATPQGPNQ